MKPRELKKAAAPNHQREISSRYRIVTEARRYFFAHGFRSVTMDDLAEELGMSKKTLYVSFPSKATLVRAVLLDKFDDVEQDLERITAKSSRDVLTALRELLACLQRHTQEIQPPFVRDIRREAPDMFQLVQSRRREIIQRYFGKILQDGRKAGIVRKDISTRIMIEILLGVTDAIMNPPKLAELGLTPKEGYLIIITVILEGVMTEKGRSFDGRGSRRG
ncbi:MAG TPA: TetR/AcrR family transcriptional regulator [Candidatus Binatia bacterium]|nr:TetR/AcrR family transcriptional regulator [Candidatus Binatia bacterium]